MFTPLWQINKQTSQAVSQSAALYLKLMVNQNWDIAPSKSNNIFGANSDKENNSFAINKQQL